jgi:hypothetical protein
MFAFLRAIGLDPIEWSVAVQMTGEGSPYIGQVLDVAFDAAQAIVVLLTPDDIAYLRTEHANGEDDPERRRWRRPGRTCCSKPAWRWAGIRSVRCWWNSGNCGRSAMSRAGSLFVSMALPPSEKTWRSDWRTLAVPSNLRVRTG